jgi:hypothetical protein
MRQLGPNMRKLVATYTAKLLTDQAPSIAGVSGKILDGTFVSDVKRAQMWCKQAVNAIRNAAQPNPWVHATDEAIAGEILKRIQEAQEDERKASRAS